jgi:hypothetical protein
MTAAAIASGIDTSTVAGHNLRALLLRLLDGDDDGPWQIKDFANLRGLGISEGPGLGTFALTPLGREVAERLRPVPWLVAQDVWLVEPSGVNGCHIGNIAPRVAALLTADDLRAAKAYRVES